MSDIDGWVYFDGPEPEPIRPLLDALRDRPPLTPENKERVARQFSEKLAATLSQRGELPVAMTTPIAQAPGERPSSECPMDEGGVTVRSPTFHERTAAVLLADSIVTSPPPVDAREPRPAKDRSAAGLMITALVLDLPAEVWEQMGRLPFKPPAPVEALDPTMEVPVWNWRKGQTAPLGDDCILKAVALLPFAGSTLGAGFVPFPRLSLEQYASMRAELAVWPEQSTKILLRYHVMNEAARGVLEEHWRMQLAASPEERARFDNALAIYTAWLRTRRG